MVSVGIALVLVGVVVTAVASVDAVVEDQFMNSVSLG
jgi:hypothetical protein